MAIHIVDVVEEVETSRARDRRAAADQLRMAHRKKLTKQTPKREQMIS